MRGFILLKPEAIQRNLTGKIITILEEKGLKISAIKMLFPSKEQIVDLYQEHIELEYFNNIIECSTDGPVIAMIVETIFGTDASVIATDLQGDINLPGTIRYQFALHKSRNVIHCSKNYKEAEREIQIFFSNEELLEYVKEQEKWLVESITTKV